MCLVTGYPVAPLLQQRYLNWRLPNASLFRLNRTRTSHTSGQVMHYWSLQHPRSRVATAQTSTSSYLDVAAVALTVELRCCLPLLGLKKKKREGKKEKEEVDKVEGETRQTTEGFGNCSVLGRRMVFVYHSRARPLYVFNKERTTVGGVVKHCRYRRDKVNLVHKETCKQHRDQLLRRALYRWSVY